MRMKGQFGLRALDVLIKMFLTRSRLPAPPEFGPRQNIPAYRLTRAALGRMPRLLTAVTANRHRFIAAVYSQVRQIDTRRQPVATHMEAGDNRHAMNADRRILNPLYSDNRLKLSK